MEEEGIEQVLVLPFTPEVSHLTPEQFVRQILVERLDACAVLVGDNFRFGAGQAGDTNTLMRLGEKYGFITEIVSGVRRHGLMVSSSGIRKLLQEGDVSLANRFLERPYAMEGEIVSGHGIGSKKTVPTLNLSTQAEVVPANGVYITHVDDLDSRREWNAVTNIGVRPTFDGDTRTIETFLLDPFDGDTPARIRLEFLRRIRNERKFESPEALKAQIMKDVGRATTYFRRFRRWVHTSGLTV